MNNTNIFIKEVLDSSDSLVINKTDQYGGRQNNSKSYLSTTNEYKGTNIFSDDSSDSSISSDSSDINNSNSSDSYPLFNYYGNIKKEKKQEKGRINKKFTQNGGNRKIKLNTNINQIILKRIMK